MASNSKTRAVAFLGLAVVAGISALGICTTLIQHYEHQLALASEGDETTPVVIAKRDLYMGVMITEQDVASIDVPTHYLQSADSLLTSPEQVIGRVPGERILANEFVRPERLADQDAGRGLNAVVPRGMRAVSLDVADGHGVSGMVSSGDRVDVLVTITREEDSASETTTVLQAATVLATNGHQREVQSSDDEDGSSSRRKAARRIQPSVTLAVTPDDAERLAHAQQEGTVTLSLRSRVDALSTDLGGVDSCDLLSNCQVEAAPEPVRVVRAAPAPEQPTGWNILRVFLGTESQTHQVDDNGVVQK